MRIVGLLALAKLAFLTRCGRGSDLTGALLKFLPSMGESSGSLARRADAGVAGLLRGGTIPPVGGRTGQGREGLPQQGTFGVATLWLLLLVSATALANDDGPAGKLFLTISDQQLTMVSVTCATSHCLLNFQTHYNPGQLTIREERPSAVAELRQLIAGFVPADGEVTPAIRLDPSRTPLDCMLATFREVPGGFLARQISSEEDARKILITVARFASNWHQTLEIRYIEPAIRVRFDDTPGGRG